MQRKHYVSMMGLMLMSSLIGGALVAWLGRPNAAVAQTNTISAAQVTTQELRIVDAQGRVRLRSSVQASGEVTLSLVDGSDQSLLVLGVRPDGWPTMELRDNNGTTRIQARVTREGIPYVDILDAAGTDRLYVGLTTGGNPIVDISDRAVASIWRAPTP